MKEDSCSHNILCRKYNPCHVDDDFIQIFFLKVITHSRWVLNLTLHLFLQWEEVPLSSLVITSFNHRKEKEKEKNAQNWPFMNRNFLMGHKDNHCSNAISFRISNSATVQEDYQQMDFLWDRHISTHQKLPNKRKYIQISIQLSTKAHSSAYNSKKCTQI